MIKKLKNLSQAQTIALGFFIVIMTGTLLLMLPISSRDGQCVGFIPAMFTATSATCVTGLVVVDTYTHWTLFGQIVVISLIQIGGLGFVTMGVLFAMALNRKVSLKQRALIKESVNSLQLGGVVRLVRKIFIGTLIFELTGAFLLSLFFVPRLGLGRGIYYSIFHSISAFCNAGFDLMGAPGAEYASLTAYRADPVVNLVIMGLIVVGGIGFLTWDDIRTNGFRLHRYRMQSKVILVTTAVLIVAPAAWFFFDEFSALPLGERVWMSLFQSVTPRTAGFNTADLTSLSGLALAVTIVLMLIGGSPGSTAGGMKTTTVAVLFANAIAVFRRREEGRFFGRRISVKASCDAAAILLLYVTLFFFGGFIISSVEGLPLADCLFETASAVGTVGLSLGLTPSLGLVSRGVLIFLMYVGRVGGLTLIYAALAGAAKTGSKLPQERITIG